MEPVQQDVIRRPDGTFAKGVSGNPAGRPKGKTMKEYARDWYMNKSDEEKIAYLEDLEKRKPGYAWAMAEGNPQNNTDMTSNGETVYLGMPPEVIERTNDTEEGR